MCLLPQAKERTKTVSAKSKMHKLITELPRARKPKKNLSSAEECSEFPCILLPKVLFPRGCCSPLLPQQPSDLQDSGWT